MRADRVTDDIRQREPDGVVELGARLRLGACDAAYRLAGGHHRQAPQQARHPLRHEARSGTTKPCDAF